MSPHRTLIAAVVVVALAYPGVAPAAEGHTSIV
jgi:hypothetical protein